MTMEFADILNTLDSRLPCGEDLEYDADFLQLQQAAAGRDEQQFGSTIIAAQPPDWREVQGRECARGLINYSSADTRRILRQPSSQIARILGSMTEPELMHRDNLVVL
ncbi:hypothetical protein DAI43_18730 [Achromobacter xylosoxidans]|nr:hypothetical protein DAI43_18730 [Achromobacter xylosoxidans]